MTWLKKRDNFLPNFSKVKLKQLYNQERNGKAKLRLLVAIQRKEGKTLEFIASSLQKPKTTIHDWLKRMDNGTLDQIFDIKQKGKIPKLSPLQKEELEKILDESPQKQNIPFTLWTTKLVQYVIYQHFDVSYNQSAIWKLVQKLNFNLKIPRQENRKANKELQEKFKIELKKKFNIRLNLDSRSFVLMRHSLK
ncbi:MAG: winged helix-turn-helix domain-containing protein [Pseudomonadota bacterium]